MKRLPSGSLLLIAVLAAGTTRAGDVYFERDVRPILKAHCFHCHGEAGEKEGNLDVRLVRFMTAGGDSGAAIEPGNADASLLYERVHSGEMPPEEDKRLSDEELTVLRTWIEAGAPTLRPEPETVDGPLITEEERSHWSFQPIDKPAVPQVEHADRVRTPVDAFVLRQLEAADRTLADEADQRTLVRRLYYDLVGYPPTPEEVQQYLDDTEPGAWGRLVDRLLDSPNYGERWGRHWLDVAGYADSEGYTNDDKARPDAYKYRDYVIRSFNADKPFDRFIVEQLAGDELITSPLNNLTPEDVELLTATGFLRMGPDGTGSRVDDLELAKNDTIAETIKIVSSSLMGMTLGCAQCHDHRYDPIPQSDYYAFRAIFEPAFNPKKWKRPVQRRISLYTDEDRARAAEIEAEAKKVDAERLAKQKEFIDATFERELAKLPEEVHELARAAHATPAKERTDEQKALLKKHPSLNVTAGSLYLYDRKAADKLKEMAAEAKKIRDGKPVQEFVRALTETPGQIPPTHLFYRGDHEQPKDEMRPAGLSVVSLNLPDLPAIPEKSEELKTSGRRLALAKRLTDGNHPLVPRVIVNRIWMHHFGTGLVRTPTDFGVLGTPPTHPELLDWLAREFVESGWSVKHVHRLILNSSTWRQSTAGDPELLAADPDNELYGRFNLQRLDAEAVRDAVLRISGRLTDDLYGKPVPVMADRVGRWVLGIENLSAGRPGKEIDLKGEEFRRSVYVQVRRSRPLAVLDTFDWPRMSPNCSQRTPSTVTPQSLLLMNSDFVIDYSRHFADRVSADAGDDRATQVRRAWELAFSRPAEESEVQSALTFLDEQTALLAERLPQTTDKKENDARTPAQEALASLCQMLVSSNEFLYVE
ncbi:PSD1 and planctomycete cytochrome C domain-containing protein [Maioricimonas sp. JC845]|uniref:PSD1 and planctomycete cytochrome C domain-containing protein n=1 Tax=Maioricimonas sp. JC845 TaxID=3232138 RepID=UPI00345A5B73